MKFHIITLFPEAFSSYFHTSIMRRAQEKGAFEYVVYNLADHSVKNTRRADDRPYGGFPGTILAPEPLYNLITQIETNRGENIRKLYLSPRWNVLNQGDLEKFAKSTNEYIVICGHYEGIDQRIIDLFHIEEVSIGEYVLSSGELASMVLIDGIVRLLPGVISSESLEEESFSLKLQRKKEYPQYTRPENFRWFIVPGELLSGDPKRIEKWKKTHL